MVICGHWSCSDRTVGTGPGQAETSRDWRARNRFMYFWTLGLQKSGERTVWSANGTWISIWEKWKLLLHNFWWIIDINAKAKTAKLLDPWFLEHRPQSSRVSTTGARKQPCPQTAGLTWALQLTLMHGKVWDANLGECLHDQGKKIFKRLPKQNMTIKEKIGK